MIARLVTGATGARRRALHDPAALSPDAVLAIALLPPVAAGILLFRAPALLWFGFALGAGAIAFLVGRLARRPVGLAPLNAAVIGVALVGPLSPPVWPLLVAALAALLETLRVRAWPWSRIASGVLAYAAVYIVAGGAPAAYQRPGSPLLFPEPVQQWARFPGVTIDPVTLYVGNVAGPALCTSLLAVVIGLAWLWYARRLSLPALGGFAVATALMSLALRLNPLLVLDSGPLWFAAGFALSETRLLGPERAFQPILGIATAVLGIGLRAAGGYLEVFFIALAAVQLTYSLVEWLVTQAIPGLVSATKRRPPGRGPAAG